MSSLFASNLIFIRDKVRTHLTIFTGISCKNTVLIQLLQFLIWTLLIIHATEPSLHGHPDSILKEHCNAPKKQIQNVQFVLSKSLLINNIQYKNQVEDRSILWLCFKTWIARHYLHEINWIAKRIVQWDLHNSLYGRHTTKESTYSITQ